MDAFNNLPYPNGTDHLPLAASVDPSDLETQLTDVKRNVKVVLNKLTPSSEPLCSIDGGKYMIHYLVAQEIVYLVITEKNFPRKFAFSYLDELHKEFERSFGGAFYIATMSSSRCRQVCLVQRRGTIVGADGPVLCQNKRENLA